jgi:calcineurin-like phosphoesterase family protein
MTVYFTSDTHFGHGNIIRYCNRPFGTVAEMDDALIANWNAVVGRGDEVWHLGDFGWWRDAKHIRSIFHQLHGRKRLVIGNHDGKELLDLPWSAPPSHYVEISVDRQRVVLFHYGMRVWNGMRRGAVQLYGHSHGRLPGTDLSLDVGADCWNFMPVTMKQIRERLASNPPHLGEPDGMDDAEGPAAPGQSEDA